MSQSVDNQTRPDVKDLLTRFMGNILSFVDFDKPPEEQGQKAFDEIVKLEADIQKLLAQAGLKGRIDELKHIGFDKRLDNPILSCIDVDRPLGADERIAELEASLKEIA